MYGSNDLLKTTTGEDIRSFRPPTVSAVQLNSNDSLQSATKPKIHGVKIISPTKGEQIPIDTNFQASGTSIDNVTSECQVGVNINGIKPYQNASATGPAGANDYSKWNFVLSPKYTVIKEGPNMITAKISCIDGSTTPSFNSVNFTVIHGNNITKQAQQVIAPEQSKLSNTVKSANVSTFSTPPPAILAQNNKPLYVSVIPSKNQITAGNTQQVTVTIFDASSNLPVAGAKIRGEINASKSIVKTFGGTSDENGQVLFSWKLKGNTKPGKFTVTAQVFEAGYRSTTADYNFQSEFSTTCSHY